MLNHALAQITGFRAFDKKAVGPDQAGRMSQRAGLLWRPLWTAQQSE